MPLMTCAADFNEIVNEVVWHNPALMAERSAALAEVAARKADNRLEATEIGFSHLWGYDGGGNKLSVEVTQNFDWPGVYGVRRRAADTMQKAATKACEASERKMRQTVSESLFAIIDANRRCQLLERIVANLDSMHSAAHTLLAGGNITELDHRKVALEEISMKQQLADAHAMRSSALANLAALNGGELPQGALDLDEFPAQTLLPLSDYIHGAAPELEAARLDVETLKLDAEAERLGCYPGFSLGYAFEREDEENFNGFTIGLRFPQYSVSSRARATLLRAEARELLALEAEQTRRADITSRHAEAEQLVQLMADYDRALGSGNYEALLKRSLAGRQITYAEYFTELNFYLAAVLESYTQDFRLQTLLSTLNTQL